MLNERTSQMMVESRTEISGQIKDEILRSTASDLKKPELASTMVSGPAPQACAGCGSVITDRFLLKAVNKFWHEDCLKCGACDCRLGEVGSTLYEKANLILCRRDYLRLFGSTGCCAACSRLIPAFEMVMRAREHVYHLECFACQQCNHRFCVGDRFYLCDGRILCEYDYEERRMFAAMPFTSGSLDHIKRQVNNIQADSSNTPQQQQQQQQQQHQQQQHFQPQQPAKRQRRQRRRGATCDENGAHATAGGVTSRRSFDDASSGHGSPDSAGMDTR